MKRALIVCPGRGSYDRASLGYLKGRAEAAPVLEACDAWREANGRAAITEIDAAEQYASGRHVAGENASLLTAACSWADLAALDTERYEIVGVVGNSMGWYSALYAAGALSLPEAVRLIDTMGAYQAGNVVGGQVLYPITDAGWRVDPAQMAIVDAALAAAPGGNAWWSIRLGAYAVLGADEPGCKHLMDTLPKIDRGTRQFPARLPLHSAFHTPLLAETSERARGELADLAFQAPRVPLVDGSGRIHRPRWASPTALWGWTLGAQVVDVYDFALSVRVALRHTGADVVVALGPGNSLGAPLASVLVEEGWGGARSRADLEAIQAQDPLLLAFGVPDQRARLVRA